MKWLDLRALEVCNSRPVERSRRRLAEVDGLIETEGAGGRPEFTDLVTRRRELRDRLKDSRERKRAIAASFRECSGSDADLAALKQRMTDVSAEIGRVEKELKDVERLLTERLAAPTSPNPAADLPAHLAPASAAVAASHEVRIEPLSASNRAEWDAFVATRPRATLYHDSRWATVIESSMRQRTTSLLARGEDGNVIGVLPLCQLRSAFFGDFAVSLPYFNYGGALGTSRLVEEALMEEASQQAAQDGLRHVEFRDTSARYGWRHRDDKVTMVRRLPDSTKELSGELGSKVRSQIRRAQRENISVRYGDDAAQLSAFYDVFATNMRDLGTPVYHRGFFESILECWADRAGILTVKLAGRPVGGAFLIRHRDTLEIPWASTLRATNRLGINMLMYWEALSFAIEQKCRYFDFGRSTRDSGTFRFKSQWGASPVQLYWHYWTTAADLPKINPDNPRYRNAIALWRRLPVRVTRWIGPRISRSLP